ncbi:MAG: glycosyltransferase family 2 protein [Mariprofundaceae bacterium]|nr:glycosyltransferase family 2 protein [Mariprofundaceae bacterium]
MKLSVIIPAYNEAERLPSTLKDAYAWLTEHLAHDFELCVVDDGSGDQTCECVRQLMSSMPELLLIEQTKNIGKGAAVRRGMLAAKGDIQVFLDADHSTHIREIEKVFAILQTHPQLDVVIASRQHPDSDISQHQSWVREHMGKSFNMLMRLATGIDMQDTQCGFKAFTAKSSRQIFMEQKLDGFSFDVEVLFLATQMGYRIAEIPVEWVNESNSKVRMLIDPLKMFIDILKIRRLHRMTPLQ